ncbi:MAG: CoB--CoM heterodisulfide reductase iron-sulfur subunit A family protein [Chthonomonadales bacterium]|nr:CoB--CoM heterodisulfide reductase iron-sulfur subunit A family protein [Chthonomonadales bacterium]
MDPENGRLQADVLVVGAGIAGLQASLDLADQGYSVALVERQPSIGGTMINLSKVFPTLDCASCITTPRMASAAHHPNIDLFTMTEVQAISRTDDGFEASLVKKPRFIEEDQCIGCRRCEEACSVFVPDEYDHGLGARKAISIPFTNAIPQYPVLDEEACMLCGACAKACPTQCINFVQEPRSIAVEAKAVIVTTCFDLTPMDAKKEYGGGIYPNVLSPLQMERLLAPHGPYGAVLRPSDGKTPDSIAYVQCAGSRDLSLGVPYCSRVCCMYAIKQAMLLSGSLPIADITIYYMDIRAFGKGYEQFYQNARAMGINFVKAKVARIREDEDHNLLLRIERQDTGEGPEEVQHDLVVLSLGMVPAWKPTPDGMIPLQADGDGFLRLPQSPLWPNLTTMDGVFAAGVATGPKDIVDAITDAGAAAMAAANYVERARRSAPALAGATR